MKFDAPLRNLPLATVPDEARRLESMGFDGIWSFETQHDPFFPLLQVALASDRLEIGTNIAVAFARTPFSMAMTAWDLQRASAGRFQLGLGTQVRAHVERRFSAEFEHPAARVTDYIRCMRAIWDTFQNGTRPEYDGPFYRFKVINDFFNPGPIEHPEIPVLLAGVNPRMARAAGEVADGFNVHPMHSPGFLRDVVRPAIDEGARTRNLTVEALTLVTDCFVVRGEDESARAVSEQSVRQQVAFYASTPSYRSFLEYHGFPDLGKSLSAMMRERRISEMGAAIPDALLAEVAVSEANGDLGEQLRARYEGGLVQRVLLYEDVKPDADPDAWRALGQQVRSSD